MSDHKKHPTHPDYDESKAHLSVESDDSDDLRLDETVLVADDINDDSVDAEDIGDNTPIKLPDINGSMETMSLFMHQVNRYPLLSHQEFLKVFERYKKDGDAKAFEILVMSNIRLVVKIAKRYGNLGVPMNDIISDGTFGLFRALELFEPEKGFRFSTYATNWIKQHIIRSLYNTRRMVRIPTHMEQLRYRYNKLISEAEKRNEPISDEELCEKLEISEKQLDHIRRLFRTVISSHLRSGDDGDGPTIEEQLWREDDTLDEEGVHSQAIKTDMKVVMAKTLTEREARVIQLRFGFGSEPLTLEEVGKLIGVTRERIRQIENQAVRKMKRFFNMNGELKDDFMSKLM